MNGLDLVAILLAIVAAAGGWRLGFLRRLSGWVGAALGIGLAIVLAPSLVQRLALASDTSIVLVSVALMVLFATVGQGLGAVVGARLRAGVDTDVARQVDAAGGSLLGVVGVIVLAWLIVPVMADAEGWPASAARTSVLARMVDEHLPPPPPQITELERQLVGGAYPTLFKGLTAAPEVPAAPSGSPVSDQMLAVAAQSAVRLEGQACAAVQSGSGFFVSENIVATNAHVVAGTGRLDLQTADGARGGGAVVAFDPRTDLALVATDLQRPPLELAAPGRGDVGLVMGFPGGGNFSPSPFVVAERIPATGFDIYDAATVQRNLLVLGSQLAPGDSGSALLRDDGAVIGVAVAVAPDSADVAYALNSDELTELLARPITGEVDTGPCTR